MTSEHRPDDYYSTFQVLSRPLMVLLGLGFVLLLAGAVIGLGILKTNPELSAMGPVDSAEKPGR